MRGTYLGNNKILVSPVWGGKLVIPADDLSLTPDLIIKGVIEEPLTNYLIKNIKENQVVFDLGANIGYFTVLLGLLVGSKGKVIAYEPNPQMYSFLIDNLSINYLHDRTNVYKKAIYSKETEMNFYQSTRFYGNSSLHNFNKEYFNNYTDEIVEVKVTTDYLDKYFTEFKHIDLVKMDIEGGEYHGFLGMEKLIKNSVIKTIIFELNKSRLQEDWEPIKNWLLDMEKIFYKKFFILSYQGDLLPINMLSLINQESYPFVVLKNK